MTPTPIAATEAGPWTVLGVYTSVNFQFKLVARRGSACVHMDRLSAEEVTALTQADIQTFLTAGLRPAAPQIANAVTIDTLLKGN